MNLKVKAQKWGNSLGMRIPKAIVNELNLANGSVLELEIQGEDLVVHQPKKKQYELRRMLRQINSRNVHSETDIGQPMGDETW